MLPSADHDHYSAAYHYYDATSNNYYSAAYDYDYDHDPTSDNYDSTSYRAIYDIAGGSNFAV